MKRVPMILGAIICALATGTVAGKSIGTEPIGIQQDVTDVLPQAPVHAAAVGYASSTPRLPDHYAVETAEGRVEVPDLAMNGRYRYRNRNPRYGVNDEIGAGQPTAAALLDAQQPKPPRQPAFPQVRTPAGNPSSAQIAPLELEQPATLAQSTVSSTDIAGPRSGARIIRLTANPSPQAADTSR